MNRRDLLIVFIIVGATAFFAGQLGISYLAILSKGMSLYNLAAFVFPIVLTIALTLSLRDHRRKQNLRAKLDEMASHYDH